MIDRPMRVGNQETVVILCQHEESTELMGSWQKDLGRDFQIPIVDLLPILSGDDPTAHLPQIDCVLLDAAVGPHRSRGSVYDTSASEPASFVSYSTKPPRRYNHYRWPIGLGSPSIPTRIRLRARSTIKPKNAG